MNLTKKQFEIFKKECEYWKKEFGLVDWEINYLFDEINEDTRGSTQFIAQGRLAIINLEPDWQDYDKVNIVEIKKVAFHEICEVMFHKIRDNMNKYYAFDYVDELVHQYIRMLENLIFYKKYK